MGLVSNPSTVELEGGGYFVRRLGFELFEQLLRLRFGRQRHCSLDGILRRDTEPGVEREQPRLMLTCLQ